MTQGKRTPTKATPRTNTQARGASGETPRNTRSANSAKARGGASKASASGSRATRSAPRATTRATTSRSGGAKNGTLQVVTDTAGEIGTGARRAATATAGFLAANALPLSLAVLGIGAGVLAVSALRRRRHNEAVRTASLRGEPVPPEPTLDEDARALLARGREELVELARRTKEGAQEVSTRVQETAVRVGDRAVELGHDAVDGLVAAEERAREFAKEHPVATGAAAVAAGVGIAMALPDNPLEKRVLAPVREKIAEKAEAAFNEAKNGVQSAFEAAKEVKNDLVAQARR